MTCPLKIGCSLAELLTWRGMRMQVILGIFSCMFWRPQIKSHWRDRRHIRHRPSKNFYGDPG